MPKRTLLFLNKNKYKGDANNRDSMTSGMVDDICGPLSLKILSSAEKDLFITWLSLPQQLLAHGKPFSSSRVE